MQDVEIFRYQVEDTRGEALLSKRRTARKRVAVRLTDASRRKWDR